MGPRHIVQHIENGNATPLSGSLHGELSVDIQPLMNLLGDTTAHSPESDLNNTVYTHNALTEWKNRNILNALEDAIGDQIKNRINGRYLLGCLFVENLHSYTQFVIDRLYKTWEKEFDTHMSSIKMHTQER